MAQLESTYFAYRTPHGPITIGTTDGAVSAVALGDIKLPGVRRPTELSNACANQLLEYFAGKRTAFDVPTNAQGTAFQKEVWRAISAVPYGQSVTAAQIAERIGKPDSFRMVGAAVKKNPLVVLIPAHRVVGTGGRTLGADEPARRRQAFLELERRNA